MPPECPAIEHLDGFIASGRLDPAIRDHVASCPRCARTVERVRANIEFLETFDDEAVLGAVDGGALPRIDGYRVLRRIQQGGQATVYEAVQSGTDRRVAVKVLPAGALATSKLRRRFQREARLAATLSHPNIVTVYDSGRTSEGRHYLAMHLVDGVPLDAYGPPGDVALLAKIARAVGHAHERGVVHRDLSPRNILIDEAGEPHIVDFGLAKTTFADGGGRSVTGDGEFVGTLTYASPEHLGGDPEQIGPPSDVYALGVIFYERLTGRMPYGNEARLSGLVRAISETDPAPMRGRGTGRIDADVEAVVLKAMMKRPEDRYPDAAALAGDLERAISGRPVTARRYRAVTRWRKWIGRNPGWSIAAVLALITMLATIAPALESIAAHQQAQRRQEALALLSGLDALADDDEKRRRLDRILQLDGTLVEAYLARGRLTAMRSLRAAMRAAYTALNAGGDAFAAFRESLLEHFADFERAAALSPDAGGRKRAYLAAGNRIQRHLSTASPGLKQTRWEARMMADYYRRAAEVDPRDARLRVLALAAYAAESRLQDEAAAEIERLEAEDRSVGRFAEFWWAQAHVFVGGPRQGYPEVQPHRDLDRALRATDKLVYVLEPTDGYAWSLHGHVLKEMGRYREAILALRTAIEHLEREAFDVTKPDNRLAPAKADLATCLAAVGEPERAWPLFEEALERSGPGPGHPALRGRGPDGRSPIVLIDWAEAEHAAGMSGAAGAHLGHATYIVETEHKIGIPSRVIPVAWSLLTWPDPAHRDPATAARLLARMRRGGTLSDDPTVITLLILAHARDGAPRRALDLAAELPPEALRSPYTLTALALAEYAAVNTERAVELSREAEALAEAGGDHRLARLLDLRPPALRRGGEAGG